MVFVSGKNAEQIAVDQRPERFGAVAVIACILTHFMPQSLGELSLSMAINNLEFEITRTVLARFLNVKQSTLRKDLVVKFKAPEVIDGLVTKSLINRIDCEGKATYLPKLLAFHYCGDPKVRSNAKTGLEVVLHVLHNLFMLEEEGKHFTPADIEAQAVKMYDTIETDQVKLGLYLVREFNVIGMCATNAESTEINFLTVNERIVTLDISQEWDNRVQILSRYLENEQPSLDQGQSGEGPLQFLEAEGFRWSVDHATQPASTKDALDHSKAVPRAFISYSWDSPEHKQWVTQFASRLQQHGVSVILDRWHLRRGGDRNHFMEASVAGSDFVILVCTPEYAAKANERKGGVGYEALIITGELAEKIDSQKFIPVLRTGEFESAFPVWIKSRLGVDLRGNPYREDEYEDLVRTLHGESVEPPPIGTKPDWRELPTTVSQSNMANAASEEALDKLLALMQEVQQLPDRRPEIRIEEWGPPKATFGWSVNFQLGFHLHNSGRETALGVTIQTFQIECGGIAVPVQSNDPAVIAIDAEKDAFALIFVGYRDPLTRFGLDSLLKEAYQDIGYADQTVMLTLNYHDAHGRYYQTDQPLIFTPRLGRIRFGTPHHKLVAAKTA